MSFKLSTTFAPEDLKRFQGHTEASSTKVVIAKPSSGGSDPNVAWIAYRPLLQNEVSWKEEYGIYASAEKIENGAFLKQMSTTSFPAASGNVYVLESSGAFSPPQAGGTENTYKARNFYNNLPTGFLTFGLFQEATINGNPAGRNAVSAAKVIYQSTATMTPYTTVYLWTQSEVSSNTVVTTVMSTMTRVTFGGLTTEIALRYDPPSGTFLPTGAKLRLDEGRLRVEGGEDLPEGIRIDYILPALAA